MQHAENKRVELLPPSSLRLQMEVICHEDRLDGLLNNNGNNINNDKIK